MARHCTIGAVILVVFVASIQHRLADARAAELPTKFTLETTNQSPDQKSPTKWEQGMELLGRVGDALRLGRGRLVNSAVMARNVLVDRAEIIASEARNNVASVIAANSDIITQGSEAINSFVNAKPLESLLPARARETVRLESEAGQGLLERQKPNPIGNFFEAYLKPRPLIDNIREEDKYGNSGDKFIGIGRALVGGFEGLSNFLNAVVDFPIDSAKKTSRGVTEALNQLGGRLVGLQ